MGLLNLPVLKGSFPHHKFSRISALIFLCIICFTCLLTVFPVHSSTTENESSTHIYGVLESESFKYLLVSCGSVSLVVVFLYWYEMFMSSTNDGHNDRLGGTPRFVLVHSMPTACAVIFFIAIPMKLPRLLICMISIRCSCIIYGVLMHVYEKGGNSFKSYFTILSLVFAIISRAMSSWQFLFNISQKDASHISIAIEGLALICFQIIQIPWSHRTMQAYKNKEKLSAKEIETIFYIIAMGILGAYFQTINITFYSYATGYDTQIGWFLSYLSLECLYNFIVILIPASIRQYEIVMTQKSLLETKRVFVRFISHEVRNPLNTTALSLDILENEFHKCNASKECYKILEDIRTSCTSAVNILNETLDYEKLEAGIMSLDRTVFPAFDVVQGAVQSFMNQASSQGIEMAPLTIDISDMQGGTGNGTGNSGSSTDNNMESYAPTLPVYRAMLQADVHRVVQVIRNLIGNALKFTPRGGVVSVSASLIKEKDDANDNDNSNGDDCLEGKYTWFRIKVVDSGVGIAKENIPKLFKDIIQFNPGKLQNGGGSGLGLWISKSIVDLHNGRISVLSDGEGHGCTFILDLPIDHMGPNNNLRSKSSELMLSEPSCPISTKLVTLYGDEIPLDNADNQSDEYNGNNVNVDSTIQNDDSLITNIESFLHNCNVLVVDDAPLNRKLLRKSIQSRTCKLVHEAEDGLKAVEMVKAVMNNRQSMYDIITMDYQMPRMDGAVATKTIRELGYKGMIIGVTGNGMKVDVDHFLSQGLDRLLMKPITIAMLEATIQELVMKDPKKYRILP